MTNAPVYELAPYILYTCKGITFVCEMLAHPHFESSHLTVYVLSLVYAFARGGKFLQVHLNEKASPL